MAVSPMATVAGSQRDVQELRHRGPALLEERGCARHPGHTKSVYISSHQNQPRLVR